MRRTRRHGLWGAALAIAVLAVTGLVAPAGASVPDGGGEATATAPTNAVPTDVVPTESAPTDTAPTGMVPTDTAPTDTAPMGVVPTHDMSRDVRPASLTIDDADSLGATVLADPGGGGALKGEAAASGADPAAADRLERAVNDLRTSRGLTALMPSAQLDALAQQWVAVQAAQGEAARDWDALGAYLPAGYTDYGQHSGRGVYNSWRSTDDMLASMIAATARDADSVQNLTNPGDTHIGSAVFWVASGARQYLYVYQIVATYPEPGHAADELLLYRFYRPDLGTHFYTASTTERDQVLGYPQYRYEGVVGAVRSPYAAGASLVGLHRFYKPGIGTHFYTPSDYEASLVSGYSEYRFESVSAKVSLTPQAGTTRVYRFYKVGQGTHFYTASASEAAQVRTYPQYREESDGSFYIRPVSALIS